MTFNSTPRHQNCKIQCCHYHDQMLLIHNPETFLCKKIASINTRTLYPHSDQFSTLLHLPLVSRSVHFPEMQVISPSVNHPPISCYFADIWINLAFWHSFGIYPGIPHIRQVLSQRLATYGEHRPTSKKL